MKNIILSITIFLISISVFPQYGCGNQFYDNGGIAGNYLPNTDNTITICPSNAGESVTVIFTAFNTEVGHDGLYVFNGTSADPSNQISSTNSASNVPGGLSGSFWGTSNPGPFTSTSPDGCLTFMFRSDAIIQSSGWIANVTCGPVTYEGFHLNAFLDSNNNGNQDSGEYNFPLGQFQYEVNGNGSIGNIISSSGFYNFPENNPANNYNFSYTINPTYNAMYNLTVPNYTGINIGSGSELVPVNFPITSLISYNDLAVSVIPISSARAGFYYVNGLSYTNFGNQTIANGSLLFNHDTANTIISTSEIVTNTSTGFTYNFNNLLPFETRFIDVTMSIPSIPTVFIGQLLTNSASIATISTEILLTNNISSITQAIVASYDPNDKTESHGEKIVYSTFASNDYLTYTIRFENTGTAPATNVLVTDILDSKIDETSVKMISSSDNYILDRVGNNLIWKFNNIQLPVSITNSNVGKGYITFKAKLKPGFTIGTNVPNTAKIYFDSNPAIDTNIFNTEFVSTLANSNFDFDNYPSFYPNPVKDNLLFKTKFDITKVEVYDINGRILISIGVENNIINLKDLKTGNYILKIYTENKIVNAKIIKE